MKGENTMGMKKKVIIGVSIFLAFGIMVALIILFAPMPMNVNWADVYDINSNVKLLDANDPKNKTGSTALVKYDKNGKPDSSDWKILQFTDMHLSETNEGDLGNDRTIREFIAAIEREEPDFVALTGDIITSIAGRARAVQLCEIMEKLGVYWAYNLGNHEGDEFFKMTRSELMRIIEKYPHCLSEGSVKKTKDGQEVWGIGNFVVNLLGADYEPVQSLIFMDSGDAITDEDAKKFKVEEDSYDYLKPSQVTWYKEQVNYLIENWTGVKTMLFIHIPLVEQRELEYVNYSELLPKGYKYADVAVAMNAEGEYRSAGSLLPEGWEYVNESTAKNDKGETVALSTGIPAGWTLVSSKAFIAQKPDGSYVNLKEGWDRVEGVEARNHKGEVVGTNAIHSKDGWKVIDGTANFEGVCSSDYNNEMYKEMEALIDGVNALFCGHDHTNDSILYKDAPAGKTPIYLAYGICSGYATYNLYGKDKSSDKNNLKKGYSVIEIHSDSTFDFSGVSYDYAYKRTKYIENSIPVGA